MLRFLLSLTLLGAAGAGNLGERQKNQLPEAARAILAKAEQVELLSLNPRPEDNPRETFHDYSVLGKLLLKDKKLRGKVIAAIQDGIAKSDGSVANCFRPRHGLRASHEGKTLDLVICYECSQIAVYLDNKEGKTVLTDAAPQAFLNKTLADAKVPLAPKK